MSSQHQEDFCFSKLMWKTKSPYGFLFYLMILNECENGHSFST